VSAGTQEPLGGHDEIGARARIDELVQRDRLDRHGRAPSDKSPASTRFRSRFLLATGNCFSLSVQDVTYGDTSSVALRNSRHPDDGAQQWLDLAEGQPGQRLAHHVGALAVSEQLMDVVTGRDNYLHLGLQLG
jgi:hypothetical protein